MESVPDDDKRGASGFESLTSRVAITVALVATFLGICMVKDDNIVQAMQQAQSDRLDHWNFYQARNIRQDIAAAEATQLRLSASAASAACRRSIGGLLQPPTRAQPRNRRRWHIHPNMFPRFLS